MNPLVVNVQGESLAADALGRASDVMMAHPLALQLRNLQTLVEIGVERNTTIVFPAPLMGTVEQLATFLARDRSATTPIAGPAEEATPARSGSPVTAAGR